MTDYPKDEETDRFAASMRELLKERGIDSVPLISADDMLKKCFAGNLPEPDIEEYGQNADLLLIPEEIARNAAKLYPKPGELDELSQIDFANDPTDSSNACATCCKQRLVILIQREKAILRKDEDGVWHWHGIIGRMTAQIIDEGGANAGQTKQESFD